VLFIFDINETLLDMRPLDDVIGSTERRREWFALVIKAALVSASTGVYRDFADLGGAAAAMCGLGEDAVERLGATMRTLPGHPDVLPGLKRLRGGRAGELAQAGARAAAGERGHRPAAARRVLRMSFVGRKGEG